MSAYTDLILAESALQSYLKLDEASGNVSDSKGAIGGTAYGSLTYAQGGYGVLGNAIKSDGASGSGIRLGTGYQFSGTANFTVEAWIYPVSTGSQRFISRYGEEIGKGWLIAVNGGKFYATRHDGSAEKDVTGSTSFSANTWYHVAITYDGTYVRLYVNGVLDGTSASTSNSSMSASTAVELTFFNSAYGSTAKAPSACRLQHVAIYNAALSRASLSAHYSAGNPKTATDTWAWSDSALHPLPRTASDTWAWSDSVSGQRKQLAGDTWGWSDTTSRGTAAGRTGGTERTVWASGEDGWGHYAFASVCRTLSGKLVAVARRATDHNSYDGSIVLKRSGDDGASWGDKRVVLDGASTGWDERDPKIVCLSSGRLVITSGRRKSSSGFDIGSAPPFLYSDDEGLSWTVGTANTQHSLYIAGAGDGKSGLVYGSDIVELDSPSHLLMFGYGSVSSTFNARYQLFCSETTDGGATWSFKCYPATYADAGNYNAVEPQAVKQETGQIYLTWHRESSTQKWYSSVALTPYTSWTHTQQALYSINRQGLARTENGRGVVVSGVTDDTGQYWYQESRNYGVTFNGKTQVNPSTYSGIWPTWIMSVDLAGTGDTQNIGFIYCEERATYQDQGSVRYRQFSGLDGIFAFSRVAQDTWSWSDSVTRAAQALSRTLTDTWAWADTATRSSAGVYPRIAADTWAWSDSLARGSTRSRTPGDSWGWSDTSTGTVPGLSGAALKLPATANFVSARSQTANFVSAKSQTADFVAGAT